MNITWRVLNEVLASKTEEEVLALLNFERENLCRVTFLERLHQRYCSLRSSRERIELLKEAKAP